MLHGCINRGFLNQDQPDYETHVDDSTSVYGNGSTSTLPDSSGLSDNTLVDMVNDYSTVVRKLDSEDVDDMEADAIASTGSLSTWFDCIKDDFCTAPKAVPTKSSLLVVKLSHQDASDPVAAAPKSRKTRKSALTEGRNHAVHDSEMDGVAPLLVDEKRKRRYVESSCFYQVHRFLNGMRFGACHEILQDHLYFINYRYSTSGSEKLPFVLIQF